jgi:hypothetical protein
MWNAKKNKMFLAVCLISFIMITPSCTNGEKTVRADFEFVKADKYFVPPADETIAILFCPDTDDCHVYPKTYNNIYYIHGLFGDKKEAERIIGKKLKACKLVKGRDWLEKIVNEYNTALKNAEEEGFERHSYRFSPNIVFITQNKGYMRGLKLRDKVAYEKYMESVLLKEYFEELGFIQHIEPYQADKYFVPPKDKTVAIFLYADSYCFGRRPLAIFGDKKLGEKLLYGDKKLFFSKGIEPEKVFKGREWLEKIIDAYEVALKQAKEDKKEKVYQRSGSIVFLTKDEGYIRGIDVGEDTIYDDVAESNLLKTYFDELGLTKELLKGGSPVPKPKKFKLAVPSYEYYIPPAGETTAILLCRNSDTRDINTPIALFGDTELTGKIMGRSLEPKKVFEDRTLLKKIVDAYRSALKEAEESHFDESKRSTDSGVIFFVTPTEGFMRTIGINEDTIYDHYMESELLKKYFDELGLTNELPPERLMFVTADDYFVPTADETVAILLERSWNDTAALIGDKKETEKIMGGLLEPEKVIEGRDWLVKIVNAYEVALKNAKEKEYCRDRGNEDRRIWFITLKKVYIREIGIDKDTVYDNYMESEQLKEYFDELSLTKELLAGEPNAIGG